MNVRRTPWRPAPGLLAIPEALENLAEVEDEDGSFWAHGADPEVQDRVERMLSRIPERWRIAVRLIDLEGKSGREAGEILGISQPSAWALARKGRWALSWAAETLPDLTTEDVEQILVEAREPERLVGLATFLWREWLIVKPGTKQMWTMHALTGWRWLHDRKRVPEGLVGRLLGSKHEDRQAVGCGLLALLQRPRAKGDVPVWRLDQTSR